MVGDKLYKDDIYEMQSEKQGKLQGKKSFAFKTGQSNMYNTENELNVSNKTE